jgi:hypothetical protein
LLTSRRVHPGVDGAADQHHGFGTSGSLSASIAAIAQMSGTEA